MRWNAKRRILFTGVGIALLFTGFSARLIYIQVTAHEKYAKIAADKNSRTQPIYAQRGIICDRNGEPLAINIPIHTVWADGTHIKDRTALAKITADILQMPVKELEQKLPDAKDKYEVIKRGVSDEDWTAIQKAMADDNLKGFYHDETIKRIYPNGSMLCHVLGFLDFDNKGVQGIEMTMEKYLHGEDGYRHIERDRKGREIVVYRGQERPARDGLTINLTIDMGLQSIVEAELETVYKELKPEHATAIMVKPQTGEILAMATYPNFDLNEVNKAKPEEMKNRAIIDMVEPGSTFKIVVTSGSMNEGLSNDKSQIFCENGSFAYGGKILRDHHGYGLMGVHEILVKSSNIGSAKLALQMGDKKFYEYVRRFGFGEKTGIELPGEIGGLVHPPQRWDKLTITRMPMGHAVAVTPLQIVMGMSVIANQGTLMSPQIVKEIRDRDGATILKYEPVKVREVVRPEIARYINDALTEVVSEQGTAALARIPGFASAGKTGTAQKVNPKGGYMDGKYVVSFVGYTPAENPEFATIIIIDNPNLPSSMNYGGLVAAPVFSQIGDKSARYLDLVPTQEAIPAIAQTSKTSTENIAEDN